MLINNINPFRINTISGLKQNRNASIPTLKNDTFERTVSFGAEENLPDKKEMYSSVHELKSSLMQEVEAVNEKIIREDDLSEYISMFSSDHISKMMMKNPMQKIEGYNTRIFNGLDYDTEFFNKLFRDAGLKTFSQLRFFIRTYNQNPNTKSIFKGQNIEAVTIYGNLKNKSDLANFPEFLLSSYYKMQEEGYDFDTVNANLDFLHKIGINNADELDKKCAHLKPIFNNFESPEDKVDAVNYLRETYNTKIAYIDEIKKSHKSIGTLNSENIYKSNIDVIDYYYFGNEEPGLGGFEDIFELAAQNSKLKMQTVEKVLPFETPQDKVNFYKFLNDCSVDVQTFNALTARSVVTDSDTHKILKNYKPITSYIAETQGIDKKSADDYYVKFKDVIAAVYKDETPDSIKDLTKVIKTFGLKNADSFLQLYNKVFESKNKTITSEDVKNFVDLAVFADDKDFFKTAKVQNITPAEYLASRRTEIKNLYLEIEKYIDTDTTGYFAGQSVEEIYNQYKSSMLQAPENVAGILKSVVDFNIQNSDEYQAKAQELAKFSQFFDDRESLTKFLRENNIKLDSTEKETEYRNCCLDVLDTVKNSGGEEAERRLDYYKTSGILGKSQNKLKGFLARADEQGIKQEALCTIADYEFRSIRPYTKFIKKYRSQNGTEKELVKFLQNIPESISYDALGSKIARFQEKLDSLNVPVVINSDNINQIDPSYFRIGSSLTIDDVNKFLSKIKNSSSRENLIAVFPASLNGMKGHYSANKIAKDIVLNMDKSEESYQNIVKFLNADKNRLGLEGDDSDYLQTVALQMQIPDEFVDFVNSTDWLQYDDDKTKIPNLSLHARLRAIDRFALSQADDISVLYAEETKERLKDVFNAVYTGIPSDVKGHQGTTKLYMPFEPREIVAVFNAEGKMVTIYEND